MRGSASWPIGSAPGWNWNGGKRTRTIEVHSLLRQLQSIRLGRLELGGETFKMMVTHVPKDLNDTLAKLDLLTLFAKPPPWTEGQL